MTNPQPPENESNQPARSPVRRVWLRRLRRFGIPIGLISLAGIAGGAWWGWVFVNEQLAPLVEKNLSEALNRPVKLGKVERFTLTSLRVGASSLPPTATDTDELTIGAVDVQFDPLRVLLTRNLNLNITVDRPSIYLEQSADGTWLATELEQSEEEGPVKTEIETVRLQDAEAVLVPWSKYGNKKGQPIVVKQATGTVRFFDQNRRIGYELQGQSVTGGKLRLTGETLNSPTAEPKPTTRTNLEVQTENFLVSEIDRLAKLPVDLQAGRVNAAVNVKVSPEQEQPVINGTAQFNGVTLKIPNVPTKFVNASGNLQLRDTLIRLERVNALYGKVPLQADGDIDTKKGFKLAAKIRPVALATVVDSLQLDLPIALAGEVEADLKVIGAIDKPVLTGFVRSTKPSKIDQLDLNQFNAAFNLDATAQLLTLTNFEASPTGGGQVTGTGRIRLSDRPTVAITAQIQEVNADPIVRAYAGNNTVPFDIGKVNGEAQISGAVDALLVTIPKVQVAPAIGGLITGAGQVQLAGNTPVVDFTAQIQNLAVDPIVRAYAADNAPPFSLGLLNGSVQVAGAVDALVVNIPNVRVAPAGGGVVTGAGQVRLAGNTPVVNLTAQIQDVNADPIVRAYAADSAPPFSLGAVNGEVQLSGTTEALLVNIPNVQVAPSIGGLVTAAGQIRLAGNTPVVELTAQATDLSGTAIARAYNSSVPVAIGAINAQATLSGTVDNLNARLQGQTSVEGGTVTADVRSTAGNWQAAVTGNDVALGRLSPALRGRFTGNVDLAGTLASFNPADIRAQGQANLSEGLSVIGKPLAAQFRWDGQKVILPEVTTEGLRLDGVVYATDTLDIDRLDLNIRLSQYDLQAIVLPLPTNVQFSGTTDFTGRITGTASAPTVAGNLALNRFVLNGNAFESPLRGQLLVANGVVLDLAGQRDKIALTLNSEFLPVAFEIRQGTAIARGRTEGDLLIVNAEQVPLSLVSLPGTAALFPLSGNLTGQVAVNLRQLNNPSQLTVNGNLDVAQLGLGTYRADRFGGRVSLANGVATLSGARLQRGQTIIQVDAQTTLFAAAPQVKATVKVDPGQGRLQDVLELLQVFDLTDLARGTGAPVYGRAADLRTTPIELANARIINQLRRLSEIETLRQQEADRRAALPLPELSELTGNFNGQVSVVGSLQTGINADFNLRGQEWQWGSTFYAKDIIVDGSFKNGVLELLPLRFQSGPSFVSFSGQISEANPGGQFRMENVPIARLAALVRVPIDIEGNLNATATISGSLQNPQAVGDLSLTNGILNDKAIEDARGNFEYANAILQFDSRILVTGTEPITITGKIPRQLPFAAVAPADNAIKLDINVKNEGLAFLNLFTNQVTWENGKGRVNLQVGGTLEQPIANGTIDLDNATIRARVLADPLTGVTGRILFDRDRLEIKEKEAIRGQFGNGQVVAKGVLPIFERLSPSDPAQKTPLTVNLDKVNLNLKGLYQGGVRGNVQVTGSALSPVIGGEIGLSDGQVILAATPEATDGGASTDPGADVQFVGLKISLGDRVRVVNAPVLNFVAKGDLNISGTLSDPRPNGKIDLNAGQVNLFTTQFNLLRGYPQTAIFTEAQGLDPTLDVRLISSVAESRGYRQPTTILPSEVLDTQPPTATIGGTQTIRIEARVQGRASQIFDNLDLRSSPSRSQSEIVALLGGGFVSALGRGDGGLGLANIASSALLTNVQSTIGNILGLSEFRLFPTLIQDRGDDERNRESRSSDSSLGIGAEAAIDITPRISFSVLGILGANQPPQFGLRYRFSDQLLFRSSTDFSGDTRAVVEFESRF
jgi:translocation and assembly module TamB